MKKAHIILGIICVGILTGLAGCTSQETGEKTKAYSYEELDDTGKNVVDGVYEYYDYWKSVHDTGKDFPCTNVTFFYEDSQLIFATYHHAFEDEFSQFGFYGYYEVDQQNGKLTRHVYDTLYDQSANTKKNVATVKAESGWSFSAEAGEKEHKDVLTNAYGNRNIN